MAQESVIGFLVAVAISTAAIVASWMRGPRPSPLGVGDLVIKRLHAKQTTYEGAHAVHTLIVRRVSDDGWLALCESALTNLPAPLRVCRWYAVSQLQLISKAEG